MGRRLEQLVFAASLLLLAALLTLWVRSYWRADGLVHDGPGRQSAVWAHSGRLIVDSFRKPSDTPNSPLWPGFRAAMRGWTRHVRAIHADGRAFIDHPASGARRRLGFAWAGVNEFAWVTTITTVAVPFWVLAAPLLIPFAVRLARFAHRRSLRRRRLCIHCGYDLRASIERCPECGTPI